jgi:hypothetical protein
MDYLNFKLKSLLKKPFQLFIELMLGLYLFIVIFSVSHLPMNWIHTVLNSSQNQSINYISK